MSKELKIKGALSKDFQQVYIEDYATNIFINSEGEIRTSSIKNDRDGSVEISSSSKDIILKPSANVRILSGSLFIHRDDGVAPKECLRLHTNQDECTVASSDGNDLVLEAGDGQFIEFKEGNYLGLRHDASTSTTKFTADANNYFEIDVDANGATTLATQDASTGVEGDLLIDADGQVKIDAAPDHHIELGKGTGFTQGSAVDASDVTIDFRDTNKYRLDMTGGSISGTLTLQFPAVSGNFVLLVAQDGSTRTINAYAVTDSGGGSGTLKWAGGSAPDLTDGGSKTDILSFYWDATNEVAYGVASLNF